MIIVVVMSVIFVGIMAYVFWSMSQKKCASNQQYISCGGGSKDCYPICSDDQELLCAQKACALVCSGDEQRYGPGLDGGCTGDYFCGPACDASKGEVIDCDTQSCKDQCTGSDVAHVCSGVPQCGPACSDGTSWDCDMQACVGDEDTYYSCNPSGVFPLITTESCDTSDPCCYQNLNQAAACFDNDSDYWWWIGQTVVKDTGGLGNVDMFAQVVGSSSVVVPYQGDSDYLKNISQCSSNSDTLLAGFRRLFRKKDTPLKSLQKTIDSSGDADYPWYGQNYTDKYLRLTAFYRDGTDKHYKTSAVLPPKMGTSDVIKLWDHHDDDWFSITSIDVADSADGDWKTNYYTKEAPSGTTAGVGMGLGIAHNQKIVFQAVDCISDLSTLSSAPTCT